MSMVMNTIKNQRGLAAVEFAIVLPVMLFLMLATAEFGRVFYHYNTLIKAVQTGARYASRPLLKTSELTNMDADFVQSIQNFVVYGNEDGGDTAVLDGLTASSANVVVSSSAADKTITIEVSYNYSFVVLSDFSLLGYSLPTLTLRASVVTDTSLG
jgi:Flp pilus assembly protein TadG